MKINNNYTIETDPTRVLISPGETSPLYQILRMKAFEVLAEKYPDGLVVKSLYEMEAPRLDGKSILFDADPSGLFTADGQAVPAENGTVKIHILDIPLPDQTPRILVPEAVQ